MPLRRTASSSPEMWASVRLSMAYSVGQWQLRSGTECACRYFTATSTTATSTFAGSIAIGNASVYANAANNSFATGYATNGGSITSFGLGSIAFGYAAQAAAAASYSLLATARWLEDRPAFRARCWHHNIFRLWISGSGFAGTSEAITASGIGSFALVKMYRLRPICFRLGQELH